MAVIGDEIGDVEMGVGARGLWGLLIGRGVVDERRVWGGNRGFH